MSNFRRVGVVAFCFHFLVSVTAFAALPNLEIPENERPQIRSHLLECQTFLTPANQTDDSVGIPFSSNNVDEFERDLQEAIARYGTEKFRDGIFYVVGIAMPKEGTVKAQYNEIIHRYKLDEVNARVKVMSAPSRLIAGESSTLAEHILQRMRYFFPSLKRDGQSPQWGEVQANWVSASLIESVNVYFIFKALPWVDASLVVTTHAIILNAYMIYSKAMLNFLFRQGSTKKSMNNVELFLKQMLLSLPFVTNYQIFGHLGDILKYYGAHGIEMTVAAFPYEMAHFSLTGGLLLALQTIFYSQIITTDFGGWVEGQVGAQNVRDARTLRPYLQIPALALDSVILMFATSDLATPLFSMGPFEFNSGHAALIGLTAGMYGFFKFFPNSLNKILKYYQRRRASQVTPTTPEG